MWTVELNPTLSQKAGMAQARCKAGPSVRGEQYKRISKDYNRTPFSRWFGALYDT